MPQGNDRNLRRLVAKLADARPEDVQDILASLDVRSRRIVQELLETYTGRTSLANPEAAEPPPSFDGLSPWLTQRIRNENATSTLFDTGAANGGRADMTVGAAAALRACAQNLTISATIRRPLPRQETWLDRLSEFLRPRTRAL